MPKPSAIAIVVPALGGGTTRHTHEMAVAWCQQGATVLLLETFGRLIETTIMRDGQPATSFFFPLPGNEQKLLQLMRSLQIGLVHYHHFIHVDEFLMSLPQHLEIPFFITLHDYYVICPMVNMVDERNKYCKELGCISCNECLAHKRKGIHNHLREWPSDIDEWRKKWHKFLLKAASIFVPQQDVCERVKFYFPDLLIHVFENPELVKPTNLDMLVKKQSLRKYGNIRRIGVIGTITPIKGATVILDCAAMAAERNLPLQFILFGTLQGVSKRQIPQNLKICGVYQEETVYRQIVDQTMDFFWFPCLCPETYNYTLSIPVQLKIPVIGADIGAVGNRIQTHRWGEVYPLNIDVSRLCKVLLDFDFVSYAKGKEQFQIERRSFPSLVELYGVDQFIQEHTVSSSPYQVLGDQMAESLMDMHFSNIIGIEYRAIFRQEKSWQWKLRMLLRVDWKWLGQLIWYTKWETLWSKVWRIIVRR